MQSTTVKRARILAIFLCVLALACIVAILFIIPSPMNGKEPVADLYQNGTLLKSIPLHQVSEPYTFTVTAEDGGVNVVEVRPGSIGILSADCPDKVCVRQGFISNSHLPITCLPHRLVIQIRQEAETWD